jgi:3-phosphoshikimate 1-carboxyvinyltransferase
MKVTIEPGGINGSVVAPASKSITQRAFAAALLHKGTSTIYNAGNSADEQAALQIVKQLGAQVIGHEITGSTSTLKIASNGIVPISDTINCNESGLSARLFTPIAALHHTPILITGHGSLLARPIEGIDDLLPKLGITITNYNGYLPYTVCGPLSPVSTKLYAGGSSQLVSGTLFAYAAAATQPVTLQVAGLKSKPYIDLSLQVLEQFGKKITHKSYREFYIDPANFIDIAQPEITIEADWSSASCMLVAGAVAGSVTIANLKQDSLQADRAILEVLQQAGAGISITADGISTYRNALRAFEFDATHCPDLFPALAVLAVFCQGDSRIMGVQRLFHKESNRIESIAEMLWSFGISFSVEDDTLCIEGGTRPGGTVVDSYNDHRIVMAAAVCALRAKSRVDITGAEAVNKSYPDFFKDLASCGIICLTN